VFKMSLEDRFYPEDGTLLTKYDNFMIKAAEGVGDPHWSLFWNMLGM